MRTFESNRAFVQACLAELPDYERSPQLYWTLSAQPPPGSPDFLQMTLGNLILALDELRAIEATLSQKERTSIQRLQAEWSAVAPKAAWQLASKGIQEVRSRLVQWQAYVTDAVESDDLTDYASNVRPRLCALRVIEWLGVDHPEVRLLLEALASIDGLLAPRTEEGPFVLDPMLDAVYPPTSSYHFLYRRPLPSNDAL